MKRALAAFAGTGLIAFAILGGSAEGGCKALSSPSVADVEAGAAVASDLCSYIDGIDDTGIVRTICASVAEVAQIVSFILTLRTVDGGSLDASTACKPLPGTALCATSAERAKGILYVTHIRQARLMLDGGTP